MVIGLAFDLGARAIAVSLSTSCAQSLHEVLWAYRLQSAHSIVLNSARASCQARPAGTDRGTGYSPCFFSHSARDLKALLSPCHGPYLQHCYKTPRPFLHYEGLYDCNNSFPVIIPTSGIYLDYITSTAYQHKSFPTASSPLPSGIQVTKEGIRMLKPVKAPTDFNADEPS